MRLIYSHLDRTSLVNSGFMIQQRDHRFIKNQHSFISKDWKGSPLCLQQINLRESFKFIIYVVLFFLLSFAAFCDLVAGIVQTLRNLFVKVIFFLALNQNGKFSADKMGPLRCAIRTQNSPHIARWLCQRYNKLSYTHPFHLCNLVVFSWSTKITKTNTLLLNTY